MELFDTTFLHNQLVWTGAAFFVLLAIMWKMVVPAVTQVLDQRAEQIKNDLDKAENLRKQAENNLAKYAEQIKNAQAEAANLVNTAREEASKIAETKKSELEADLQRKAKDAAEAIELAKTKAMSEVQAQVAEIAVLAAEKIISESIDTKKAESLTADAVKELMN